MMFDLHNDFPTAINVEAYARYIDSAPYVTPVAAIWTSEFKAAPLDRLGSIVRALRDISPTPPIAIEDLGFLTGDPADFDFSEYFYCSLTWNYDNRFASGALGDGRLTVDGKRAIAAINGRCALDLAHISRSCYFEALELAQRPICSHTAFGSDGRCLNDAQIRALIKRHGIIGLFAVKKYTGAATAGELAETADRFVQKYGHEYLCLGTDFNGTDDLPDDFMSYGDENALAAGLERLGYSRADIYDIFYGNAQRFYEETVHERHL